MKLLMNRAAARMDSVSRKYKSKSRLSFRQLMTASALLSAFIALPATAQTNNEDFKFLAADGAINNQFGGSVAVSGTTAIVGAAFNDGHGSVYLYDTITGDQISKLTPFDIAPNDRFGISVAISGTTAIVGSYLDDDRGNNSGSVYLFDTRSGRQIAKFKAFDGRANDQFGYSVAISGTTAIVGAPFDDERGSNSGSVYVINTETGFQVRYNAFDGRANDRFGFSVAISGTRAIAGAPFNDNRGSNAGAIYLIDTVSRRVNSYLGGSPNDQLGYSVAISGITAIAGTPGFDGSRGRVNRYDALRIRYTGSYSATDRTFGDFFGRSVAILGTKVLVGADGDDDNGSASGSAYLFHAQTRQQISKIKSSDAVASDQFGTSVALSGEAALVGVPQDDDRGSNSGSVYLFDFILNILQQPRSLIVADGSTAVFSVSLADATGVDFQWLRNGTDLVDGGNISGASTSTLQVVASEVDEGYYSCVMIGGYEAITSDSAVLSVLPDPNACLADLNGDGILNFFDVQMFIIDFSRGCP